MTTTVTNNLFVSDQRLAVGSVASIQSLDASGDRRLQGRVAILVALANASPRGQ
jgi:hypothetical protein